MAQLQKQELALSSRPNTSATAISNTKAMLANQKRFIIKIPATEKDKTAVKIGINGHHILIPRDVECAVPESVLSVLNECIEEHFYPVDGGKDAESQKYEKRNVMRFPYQIIREAEAKAKEKNAVLETEAAEE